jgi:hypothetical protein
LCNREECGAEDDVANRPAVIERAEDEHELRDSVDDGADERPEDVDDPECDGLGEAEAGEALEGRDGEEEGNAKDDQTRDAEELGWDVSARFVGGGWGWRTQSERGVPSSANWKPTKPLMRRQQYAAAIKPVYTAANHWNRVSAVDEIIGGDARDNSRSP